MIDKSPKPLPREAWSGNSSNHSRISSACKKLIALNGERPSNAAFNRPATHLPDADAKGNGVHLIVGRYRP